MIEKEEERRLSGLDEEGYRAWTQEIFPAFAGAQIDFAASHNLLNIDGKGECVAYRRKPVITDYACTVDENRLMIVIEHQGEKWALPSNKEIQRAVFTAAGVDSAISKAKERAKSHSRPDAWREYMQVVLAEKGIDLREVAERSCELMAYAVAEVGNRVLEKRVFDVPAVEHWKDEFMPYASRLSWQG